MNVKKGKRKEEEERESEVEKMKIFLHKSFLYTRNKIADYVSSQLNFD